MNVKEALRQVGKSYQFKEWKKENKKSYLCSFFRILEENDEWQVDFYNKNNDTITSFVAGEEIKILEKDSKIFKHKETEVNELKINKIKVNFEKALDIVNERNHEGAVKKIIILQNLDNKTVWNITYITNAFSILNMKLDAISGEVLEQSLKPIVGYKES